jgi:hypothetical protein
MSHFRSIFRFVSPANSYQVSDYGPQNLQFDTFLPSDIAGLAGWWDAADDAYITGTGNNITHWSNKGSAGGNISGTLDARLTKAAGYKNGRQAIYFSTGSSTASLQTSINANVLDGATSKCWFAAFQSNPDGIEVDAHNLPTIFVDRFVGVVLAEGKKSPGVDDARWYFGGSGVGYTQFLSSSVTATSGSNFIINTVAQVDTTNPYANQLTMSINNNADVTRISTDFMDTNIFYPYGVGSKPTSGQRGTPRNRYWYEILFYTGTLTQSERTQVVNYLNDKWGIF